MACRTGSVTLGLRRRGWHGTSTLCPLLPSSWYSWCHDSGQLQPARLRGVSVPLAACWLLHWYTHNTQVSTPQWIAIWPPTIRPNYIDTRHPFWCHTSLYWPIGGLISLLPLVPTPQSPHFVMVDHATHLPVHPGWCPKCLEPEPPVARPQTTDERRYEYKLWLGLVL